jgi:RimJ/RimL family protein N-acetyltransferase
MPALVTGRLRLRPCSLDDVEPLHTLCTRPEIRRFLFDDRSITLSEARSLIEASTASFHRHGYGLWLYCDADSIAGFAGFLDAGDKPPRLVFATRPDLWGQGYATEAAAAVLHYAQASLRLECVAADADEPNAASIAVLENLGMKQTRREVVAGRPLLFFELRHARPLPV